MDNDLSFFPCKTAKNKPFKFAFSELILQTRLIKSWIYRREKGEVATLLQTLIKAKPLRGFQNADCWGLPNLEDDDNYYEA